MADGRNSCWSCSPCCVQSALAPDGEPPRVVASLRAHRYFESADVTHRAETVDATPPPTPRNHINI